MAVQVLLPKLGLTMEEGLIEEWLVAPGTQVRPGDLLMRLATDKVDAEIEAEASGLFHPVVPAGTTLAPGALVGWLLEPGEEVPGADAGTPDPDTAATVPSLAMSVTRTGEVDSPVGPPRRLFASPNARRLARERGVDLATVRGTGPNGRIVGADVDRYATQSAPTPEPPQPGPRPTSPLVRRDAAEARVDLSVVTGTGPGGRVRRSDVAVAAAARGAAAAPEPERVIPLSGMRGVIAARMHASLQEMAQLTLGTDATMDAVVALRAELEEQWSAAGRTVPTINDFVVRAAALALREHPRLNATVRDDGVHVLPEVHVGLAVALDDGLVVPVVRTADQLALSSLAAETRRLAAAARSGALSLPELEGGTFTVSTLGGYGIDFFTPVVTPGQVAILGVGRLRDGVRWEGATPLRTRLLTLSLTFDHRAVDGAPAADYLRTVATLLANPLRLLV